MRTAASELGERTNSSSVSLSDYHRPHDTPPQHLDQQSDAGDSPDHLCDERLGRFEIHHWLQTRASTSFAARVISHYLVTEHPTLGLFDADLFLEDLAANKIEFCSPLLLGALLSFACQGYSKFEPDAIPLSFEFFVEAERLYREEKTVEPQYDTAVMTVAAAQLLSLAALHHGNQAVSLRYMHDGIQLGCENGMLAVRKTHSARNWLDDHILSVRAASHTAWGTFCLSTFLGMNYRYMFTDIHPWLPIPGTEIERSSGDSIDFPLPEYMGQSFTHLCRLASIIRQVLDQYHGGADGSKPSIRTSQRLAETIHEKLMVWADTLPATMSTIGNTPAHVTVVHLYLHAAICDLFRPLSRKNPSQPVKIHRCNAKSQTAKDVYLASVNQLKHLVLIFRTQYPHATASLGWHNVLLYIANACILQSAPSTDKELADSDGMTTKTKQERRRDWFLVCIDAYRDLAPQFALVEGILQELLTNAQRGSLISADEAQDIMLGVKMMAPVTPHVNYKGPHNINPFAASLASSWKAVEPPSGGLLFGGQPGTSAADAGARTTKFLVDLNSAQVDEDLSTLPSLHGRAGAAGPSAGVGAGGEDPNASSVLLQQSAPRQSVDELAMFHGLNLGLEDV
ncbi:hypothetical protein BD289DRAFT_484138 [Coniella lustricola]|uniref:Transcription factor domain-containing protein n=1 Tax=Coniella lustricola TaxID=2025994 RepID=A0A2T3A2X9_9PEZI|nr:hypothetical protein BD289DRAFT_484138 [Coniella lustricola]